MMATRVRLCSFQSPTNARIISPVSDRSLALLGIVLFCNHSNTVRKTDNRRTVESSYKNRTKTEKNVTLPLYCHIRTVSTIMSIILLYVSDV